MNKSTKNLNEKECPRINLHEIDPVKFKEAFIESYVFDSTMSQSDFNALVSLFFRLSILLSDSDDISKESRSNIIQMLKGFHLLGKKILDVGGADKIEAKILLDEFIDSNIIEYILDMGTLFQLAWDIFILMECIALDDLAFELKERGSIITRFQGLLFLIEKLVKLEIHECESV